MENLHNDCCHPWTKNPFKNSFSRQFRSVNTVVTLIASRSDRVFLQTKAIHFETMMTTVDEVNSDKTRVTEEFIFRSVFLDSFNAELDE